MSTIELVDVQAKAEAELAPVLAKAAAFIVTDEATYLAADEIATEIKRRVNALKPELEPVKEGATRAWKAAVALWKRFVDDPLAAVQTLDRKRTAWKRSEDDKRAAEAEALRKEQAKKDEDAKKDLAARLKSAGMADQAAEVLKAPAVPTTVPAPVKVETPKGQMILENWQAEIVDATLIPREYLIPDLVAIGKYAKLMKSKASIPGVRFFDVGTVRRASA